MIYQYFFFSTVATTRCRSHSLTGVLYSLSKHKILIKKQSLVAIVPQRGGGRERVFTGRWLVQPPSVVVTVRTVAAAEPSVRPQFSPESCQQLESGSQLHAQARGEVRLCQERQTAAVQLVVEEHLEIHQYH